MIKEECRSLGPQDHCIQDLEKKISNELLHKWSLKEMAEILGVGQTTLNLLIKKETGLSPGQYLMHLRIRAAQKMLSNSDQSITEIAFNCGFCSSQHFASSFKKKTGYSPSAYIKLQNPDSN